MLKVVTWSETGWSFRWSRDFNLDGMMVLFCVSLWCYVVWNYSVTLRGLLCWCNVGWNDGVMLDGMMV